MKRVLLVQPSLQPPGGGSAVAAWMVEALRGHAEISILAWRGVDTAPINYFFGTALRPEDFTLHVINPTVRRTVDLMPTPHAMLQMHVMLRRARALHRARPYDLLCTANNEADLGVRGVQYVHYPWAALPRPATDLRWFHHIPGMLRGYWALCGLISDFSWTRMRSNLTLVNSEYIAGKVREAHRIEPVVLYPPVPGDIPVTPWETRRNDFLCIGRLAADKEPLKVVAILDAVRARGHDVHLHLVGSADDPEVTHRVRAALPARADWLTWHQDISRAALVTLLTESRFGIHGMIGEHFGIAVAELQRAGCITFAPALGGPAEILGREPRLLYDSVDQAVDRIDAVLRDAELQRTLHAAAVARRDLFTTERFVTDFRALVADWTARPQAPRTYHP
jgi:glycosyltransferase involved in cell wall biosynthesis